MKTYSSFQKEERMENKSCNICSSIEFDRFLTSREYNFIQCRTCGLVYQNPQPLFEDLKDRYREEYFKYEFENESNFFNLMKMGLADAEIDKLTSTPGAKKTFLDIGCATGMLLNYMKKKGWETKGVELCPESAEYGIKERKLDIRIGTLEEACLPDSSFYIVHASHLIEHVPDPKQLVLEIRRILKPEGYAVITTPNVEGFQAKLLKNRWRSAIADHLFLFSKKTLTQLFISTGFRILKIVTWGGMAKGVVPDFIKKPLDYMAKKWGCGDVMLFLISRC